MPADASELAKFGADLAKVGPIVAAKAAAATRHHGLLLVTRIKRNASKPRSGPPGPRLVTGDYVRSWSLEFRASAGAFVAEAGTNRPQGRRLEFGFSGADALGRVVDQLPYPHAGPALDETGPGYEAALAALAVDALRAL